MATDSNERKAMYATDIAHICPNCNGATGLVRPDDGVVVCAKCSHEWLICPECGSDHIAPPFGHHLAKCYSCHLAFDTMGDDEDDES